MARIRTALFPAILFGQILALAQTAAAPEARFQATANLVQVDAMVSENGRAVPDLTAADFEVYEDGKPQRIDAVTLQGGRTTMYLVDACDNGYVWREDGVRVNLRREVPPLWGVPYLRTERAVAGFLDGIVSGGSREDRVAILSTNEGSGRLEEPSGDPGHTGESLATIPLPGRLQLSCMATRGPEMAIQAALAQRFPKSPDVANGPNTGAAGPNVMYYSLGFSARGLQSAQSYGYNSVSEALDALSAIPGHKDLLIFCAWSGEIGDPKREDSIIQGLTSRANRTGISIHILNLYEIPHKPELPAPLTSGGQLTQGSPSYAQDNAHYNAAMAGFHRLARLATDTGGVFLELPDPNAGKNEQQISFDRMTSAPYDHFAELRKYEESFVDGIRGSSVYEISYRPATPTGTFHKIALKIRRPGVTARWRSGYFDTPAARTPTSVPAAAELAAALAKPLLGTAIRLRAMPFDRADEGPKGLRPIIDLVLSMDARDLTWTPQRDGTRKATVDATAAWYGISLSPEGTETHSCNIVAAAGADTPAQCVIELDPSGAAGVYFVRAAVRDAGSGGMGTAYTLAPVPEYNRDGYVTMSMPILRHASGSGALNVDPDFVPGEEVEYDMAAYSARLDQKTQQPKLTLRISLANDRTFAPVFLGDALPVKATEPGWRVPLKGKFGLPPSMPPGDYIVQFLVNDTLARQTKKNVFLAYFRIAEFHVVSADRAGSPN